MAKASTKATTETKAKANAKPAGEDKAKAAKKAANELVVTKLNANALSITVGPAVLKMLAQTEDQLAQAHEMIKMAGAKRYDSLASITDAIVKAAKADPAINLNDVFGDNKAKKAHLMAQLYIAIGVKEIFVTTSGTPTVVYTKEAKSFFPSGKEDTASEAYRKKRTNLQNFSKMMDKCAQAAAGIIDLKADIAKDTKSGSLMLTGPAVEKHFGTDKVVLNEKQLDNMKVKPSFTELARVAQTRRGIEAKSRGSAAATTTATTTTESTASKASDPGKAVVSIANSLKLALETFGNAEGMEITDEIRDAMEEVINAWDTIS